MAALYTPDRKLFAVWSRGSVHQHSWMENPPVGHTFAEDGLQMFQPVQHDGETIGFVAIESDMRELTDRVRLLAGIVIGVLIIAGLVALGLSAKLQSVVTQPILQLADTARRVSEKKDYALRAPMTYRDEVGTLVDSFNEMLAQIQEQDQRLQGHNAALEAEVAERKAAEEKLQQLASRLEASNRELTDFAYVASHDLQEPLRKIQAFGDRLKSKYNAALGEAGQDYLARMGDAAGRMQTLITDLLSFSRVTTKAQPFTPVDLDRVLREVLSDLEIRLEQTKGRVDAGNLGTVDADALQMRQLFQNLIGNALKFSKPGEPPVIRIWGHHTNGNQPPQVQVVFADNGIGFDQKYAEKIFVIFQRLHGRNEYEGTGVGLAICKKIVERHGGRIATSSTPGQGATFTVTLPVNQQQGESSHA
jgi:signal transduction histidine kinase